MLAAAPIYIGVAEGVMKKRNVGFRERGPHSGRKDGDERSKEEFGRVGGTLSSFSFNVNL